jgi:hypothetical protein
MMDLDLDRFRAQLPGEIAAHADPNRPAGQRLVAARGLLPLNTADQLAVLLALSCDPETLIADTATKTLAGLPAALVLPVLRNPQTPGWLLEGLGAGIGNRDELLPELLTNRATPEAVHKWAAQTSTQELVHERLCRDLERLRMHPEILEALWHNESVDRYVLRPPVEFLARLGIIIDSVPLFREVVAGFSGSELEEMVEQVELPEEAKVFLAPEDVEAEPAQKPPVEAEPEEEEKKGNLRFIIGNMSPGQKIAMAMRGDREARNLLIRDTNKLVAVATIRSPKITESEVIAAAQSRTVNEEVIRVIANNRDWTRKAPIRVALVFNPRTPIAKSMVLMRSLDKRKLKELTRSTGIASAIKAAAKRILHHGPGA